MKQGNLTIEEIQGPTSGLKMIRNSMRNSDFFKPNAFTLQTFLNFSIDSETVKQNEKLNETNRSS
jgi:hypothetical protein